MLARDIFDDAIGFLAKFDEPAPVTHDALEVSGARVARLGKRRLCSVVRIRDDDEHTDSAAISGIGVYDKPRMRP